MSTNDEITNDGRKGAHQLRIEVFMAKMNNPLQTIPVKPTIPSLEVRKLRASLMLEEVLETIRLGLGLDVAVRQLSDVPHTLGDGGTSFVFTESDRKPSLIEIAGNLADQHVVNEGTASACGIAIDPIYQIVSANNLMKLGPGHSFRADGKLIKPPNFVGPERLIARELQEQGCEYAEMEAIRKRK